MDLELILHRVRGITSNSKEVKRNYLFFAIKGTRHDGHKFVEDAVQKGAYAVVVERPINASVPVIIVENTRKALGISSHLFFGKPSENLKVIGITGTNGKTTTTHIIETVLNEAGKSAGLIGTIYYRFKGEILGEGRTTPEPILWHKTLKEFKELGAEYVVAEVSSHALDQYRVYPTRFRATIFTNLTQDHLDYHGDMENYYESKKKLFTEYNSDIKIINADDPYGKKLAQEVEGEVITYGKEGDLRILDFETAFGGSKIEVEYKGKKYSFTTNLVGEFQAYNLAAAIAFLLEEGIKEEVIKKALRNVRVPGRFEVVYRGRFAVVVDYAHTPDAIDNVLRTAKRLTKGRLISVYGAGGDRDRDKRPLMGEAGEKWSDVVILTSDNPRSEEPEEIIKDILKGIKDKSKVIVEPDRKKAIEKAIKMAKKGDLIAILGKGHETYQEVKGVKYPFSDKEVVKNILGGDGCIEEN